MRVLAIIPARYASTRFPAKPLAILGGKSVIERVYAAVKLAVNDVVVATDDQRILDAVNAFGGDAVMTSTTHKSGTDRCWEAYTKVGKEFDIVINVQGDEPFIRTEQIDALISCFEGGDNRDEVDIATLVKPFVESDGIEALENPNSPKVIIDKRWNAIYFSRSVIPYLRGVERSAWLSAHTYYKHIGMYGFRVDALRSVTTLPCSSLELAESLEQLRWIENGFKIGVATTEHQTIGIDTPEDLEAAEIFLAAQQK